MRWTAMMLVLISALAVGSSGCFTLVWKGTEAATGAAANNEKPDQGPVLRGVEENAGTVHNAMKKVDQAEEDALRKAKDAVIK